MTDTASTPPASQVQAAPERPRGLAICVNRRFGGNPSCAGRGAVEIAAAIEAGVRERRIDVEVERIVCFGRCWQGPNFRYLPGGAFTAEFTLEGVPALLDRLEALCGTRTTPEGDPKDLHLLGS